MALTSEQKEIIIINIFKRCGHDLSVSEVTDKAQLGSNNIIRNILENLYNKDILSKFKGEGRKNLYQLKSEENKKQLPENLIYVHTKIFKGPANLTIPMKWDHDTRNKINYKSRIPLPKKFKPYTEYLDY